MSADIIAQLKRHNLDLVEANNRYLERARAAESRVAPQPMGTAPKDETAILAYGKVISEISIKGYADEECWLVIKWEGGSTDYPGYDWSVQGGCYYATWMKPTLWMPLPEEPGLAP